MTQRKVIDPDQWPWYDHKRYSFCMAVQKGDYLFFSGNTASEFEPSTKNMVCKGDIVDQARVNYAKIKLLAETAGATMDDIVKATDYVAPLGVEKYSEVEAPRKEYFGGNYPAHTPLVVDHLLRPDAFLEVECVAVLGPSEKKAIQPKGWPGRAAILKGDLLFVSGQVGKDYPSGRLVAGQDVVTQAEQAYRNLEAVLGAAGAGFNDVVKTIDYIAPAGFSRYGEIEKIRRKFFSDGFSAHTAIGVYGNLPQDALIKVDAIAVIGSGMKEMYDLGLSRRYEGLSYRPVVKKGRLVCLSGVGSMDMETGRLIPGDILAQMERALKNAKDMLAEAGLSWNDVMMVVDSILPEAEAAYRRTAKARHEVFQGALPPSTGVVQRGLFGPEGLLLNLDIVAAAD